MAGMCCGVNIGETQTTTLVERSSKSAKRRMEIHRFNFGPTDYAVAPPQLDRGCRKKRRKVEAVVPVSPPCMSAVQNFEVEEKGEEIHQLPTGEKGSETKAFGLTAAAPSVSETQQGYTQECPKFGMTSVCGRRRDMEDAVSIRPSFCRQKCNIPGGLDFFGVFDGHGCSHVSNKVFRIQSFSKFPISEWNLISNFDFGDRRWQPDAKNECTK